MSITGRSPAGESYASQREFHKGTWSSVIRHTVAGLMPAQWRQRLRVRRRLEVARDYALDGVNLLLRRRKELIPPRQSQLRRRWEFRGHRRRVPALLRGIR